MNTADLFQPTMNNTLAIVQHALVLLLTYGTGKEWSNQRRACLTFQFKHPETDVTQDNYIDTSGRSVLLVINTATKVKHTVTINVSKDCPVLATLLKSITHPKKFTGNSLLVGFPKYVLFQYSWRQRKHFGQSLSDPSTFNTRLKEAIQFGGLCADLAKKSGGCNAARHADVAANRKRPALTQDQRDDQKHKAQKRLSSVHAAETQYDQPQ